MERSKFKSKLYWLVSALALILLIFLGYSEIKYSGNTVSVSVPGQKDSLTLDLPDYFLSDSAVPSQDDGEDGSKERVSPSYRVETIDVLPDSSLFYPPRDIPEQVDSESGKTSSSQEADTQQGGTTETVAGSNVAGEMSILPTLQDVFWINFYMTINLEENDRAPTASSSPANNNLNNVDYTRVGSGNRLDQVKVNSINNTQRITQVGRNNYANQTLINTINSELTVRSIGDFNSVTQKTFNASNAQVTAIQNGFFNRVRQEVSSNGVWGTFNRTVNEIRQTGYNNLVRTQQFGVSNTIQAIQNGSLNTIDISQEGSNNSATVRQSGSGNSVTIQQN